MAKKTTHTHWDSSCYNWPKTEDKLHRVYSLKSSDHTINNCTRWRIIVYVTLCGCERHFKWHCTSLLPLSQSAVVPNWLFNLFANKRSLFAISNFLYPAHDHPLSMFIAYWWCDQNNQIKTRRSLFSSNTCWFEFVPLIQLLIPVPALHVNRLQHVLTGAD